MQCWPRMNSDRKDAAHAIYSLPRGRLWASEDHKKALWEGDEPLLHKQKTPNLISSFLTPLHREAPASGAR